MDLQWVLKDLPNNLVPDSAGKWKCLTPAVDVDSHDSFIILLKAVLSNECFTVRSWGINGIVPEDSKALTVFMNCRHQNLSIRIEIKSNSKYSVPETWMLWFFAAQRENCKIHKQQPGIWSALATSSHQRLSLQKERSNFSCRAFSLKNLLYTFSDMSFTEGKWNPLTIHHWEKNYLQGRTEPEQGVYITVPLYLCV